MNKRKVALEKIKLRLGHMTTSPVTDS